MNICFLHEVGGQRTEDRRQKTEIGNPTSAIRLRIGLFGDFYPGFLGCTLFSSFNGKILSAAQGDVVDKDFNDVLFPVTRAGFLNNREDELLLFLLGPFDHPAFIIRFKVYQFIDVEIMFDDPFQENMAGENVAPVEVHGADKGFECIALERTVDVAGTGIEADQFFQPEFLGKFVELNAADDLRTHFRKKSFVLGRKCFEKIIGCDCIQDGIAKKLKSFVVDLVSPKGFFSCRSVKECQPVQKNISRIEPENIFDRLVENFIAGKVVTNRCKYMEFQGAPIP
jgi:hypothetical protein